MVIMTPGKRWKTCWRCKGDRE